MGWCNQLGLIAIIAKRGGIVRLPRRADLDDGIITRGDDGFQGQVTRPLDHSLFCSSRMACRLRLHRHCLRPGRRRSRHARLLGLPERSLAQNILDQPVRAAQRRNQAAHQCRGNIPQRGRHFPPRRRHPARRSHADHCKRRPGFRPGEHAGSSLGSTFQFYTETCGLPPRDLVAIASTIGSWHDASR